MPWSAGCATGERERPVKIRLNLATAPLENQRRFVLGAFLAGGLALALFAFLSVETYRNWRANRDLRREVARLQNELRAYRSQRGELEEFFRSPETRRVMDRAGFLNGLIEQRSFPWTRIFSDLERLRPEGVRVVSIAPHQEDGRVEVKLVLGAISNENKIKFLKTLEESPEFSRVQVAAETKPAGPEQGDRVVIELLAWYKSDLPPESQPPPERGESKPKGTD